MKISRNAPCPCGSGRKFKHCCLNREIEFLEDAGGEIYAANPLPPEGQQALLNMAILNTLFEPPPLEQIEHNQAESMREVGVHEAIIHASLETGMVLCDHNQPKFTGRDMDEWNDCLEAWSLQNGEPLPEHRWMTNEQFWAMVAAGAKRWEGRPALRPRSA